MKKILPTLAAFLLCFLSSPSFASQCAYIDIGEGPEPFTCQWAADHVGSCADVDPTLICDDETHPEVGCCTTYGNGQCDEYDMTIFGQDGECCGNGSCDPFEVPFCPDECVCTGLAATCGNGVCEASENFLNNTPNAVSVECPENDPSLSILVPPFASADLCPDDCEPPHLADCSEIVSKIVWKNPGALSAALQQCDQLVKWDATDEDRQSACRAKLKVLGELGKEAGETDASRLRRYSDAVEALIELHQACSVPPPEPGNCGLLSCSKRCSDPFECLSITDETGEQSFGELCLDVGSDPATPACPSLFGGFPGVECGKDASICAVLGCLTGTQLECETHSGCCVEPSLCGKPCGIDVGECVSGTIACDRWGVPTGECVGATGPSPEVCGDGLDNDCDGRADPNCCPRGDCGLCGQACGSDVGACTAGEYVCEATGYHCTGILPTAEIPGDGIDNDCDRQTDEDDALRTVFINRQRGDYAPGPDDPAGNTSPILASPVHLDPYLVDEATWGAVMDCVRNAFAPFAVTVTEEEPAPGTVYSEAVVGGLPTDIGLPNGVLGVASFDYACLPPDPAVVFVFAGVVPGQVNEICYGIAHEVGHTYNLDHELLAEDFMSYLSSPTRQFVDQDAPCGEFTARSCGCGGDLQNSFQTIQSDVGPVQMALSPLGTESSSPTAEEPAFFKSEVEMTAEGILKNRGVKNPCVLMHPGKKSLKADR